MQDYQSQSHVKWKCRYHIVWCPKYRRKELYGKVRKRFGEIIRDLCRQNRITLVEGQGHAQPDHVHLCLTGVYRKQGAVKRNRIITKRYSFFL